MRKLFTVIGILCVMVVTAQSKFSTSALMLLNDYAQGVTRSSNENSDYVSLFIETDDAEALSAYGITVRSQAGDITTANVPVSLLPALKDIPEIKYVDAPNKIETKLDKALPLIGYDQILTASYTPEPYLGKGVIVGIVDIGFQWNHCAFLNPDGTSRIIAAWNQNDNSGTAPEEYDYGTVYTDENDLTWGICNAGETHGTHVAGIAGGSAHFDIPAGGVAREASFVFVEIHESMENSRIADGISYIHKIAQEMNMPCVVNLSLGNTQGPHDGTSTMDRFMDELQGPGFLIVGAAGNEGQNFQHIGYDFNTQPAEFCTGVKTMNSYVLPVIDSWSDAPVEYALELWHGKTDTVIDRTDWMPAEESYETTLKYFDREITVTSNYELNPYNNKHNIFIYLSGIRNLGNAYFSLKVRGTSGTLNIWGCNYTEFVTHNREEWISGDHNITIGEIGGTGKRITTVGAFVSDTLKSYNPYNKEMGEIGSIASFSSIGYTADGRIKPEIVAPGSIITSSVNNNAIDSSSDEYLSHIIFNDTFYYGAQSGTSMATPIVTGTYALWLQAKPDLTPEEAKEIIRTTAIQDEFTTDERASGYGKINPYGGLVYIWENSDVQSVARPTNVAIYPSIGNGRFTLNTTDAEQPTCINIYNTAGVLVASYDLNNDIPYTPMELNIPGAQQGVYYIQVATDNTQHTFKYVCR